MNTCREKTAPNGANGRPKRTPKAPRQAETLLDGLERVHSCDEVNRGFSPEQAQKEALRCLNCVDPKCTGACPLHIDIRRFIERLTVADFAGALETILERSPFPGAGGRASMNVFARTHACWGPSCSRWRLDRSSASRPISAGRCERAAIPHSKV